MFSARSRLLPMERWASVKALERQQDLSGSPRQFVYPALPRNSEARHREVGLCANSMTGPSKANAPRPAPALPCGCASSRQQGEAVGDCRSTGV